MCPALQSANCGDECVACLWLVQSWPVFTSVCAPKPKTGGTTPKTPGKSRFADVDAGDLADDGDGTADTADLAGEEENPPTLRDEVTGENEGEIGAMFLEAAAGRASPSPRALTSSAWRRKSKLPLVPKGLGSPPLSVADKKAPKPSPAALTSACHKLYWAVAALPEAWAAITAGGSDTRLAGAAWDPVTACRCLQQCPYNSIDALAVEDSCGGVFDERAPSIAAPRLVDELAALSAEVAVAGAPPRPAAT